MDTDETTIAQLLVEFLAANGVKRMFGIPGGGSSLDLIQAAAEKGVDFVLTRTENAAVMMAATTAEMSGTLGVGLTTKGPGIASATNGIAYAALDRAPVLVLSDGFTQQQQSYVSHQVFDQQAMLRPLTKSSVRLDKDTDATQIKSLIELAMTPPVGPVHIELTADIAKIRVARTDENLVCAVAEASIDSAGLAAAGQLLKNAARPVVVVGLESRDEQASSRVREFVAALNCPVFLTYKAKGVISDADPRYIGIFTGGAAEDECASQADLIVLCGVDPVEFVLQPWRYNAPVIDISTRRHTPHYVAANAGVYGVVATHLEQLLPSCAKSAWDDAEMSGLRKQMLKKLQYPARGSMGPQHAVEIAQNVARETGVSPRITVDAGAHMFSAMAFWQCDERLDVLISNGLATMAFALPAAIAASLEDPSRPVIAFTGDGGLLMCIGELLTAVQQQTHVIVVVFNDGSLSLIDIKQQRRKLSPRGVRWDRPEFGPVMKGFGGRSFQVSNESEFESAINQAITEPGPALIDVLVDPQGYSEQLTALRG